MKLILETPVKLRILLEGESPEILHGFLTYRNNHAQYELKRFINSRYNAFKFSSEEYKEKVRSLELQLKQHLLFEDEKGYWTYSGLKNYLVDAFNASFESKVQYPDFKLIPWARDLDFTPREVQLEIKDLLIKAKHGSVEAATGIGKSICLMLACKEMGLKTWIVVPTLSILDQIYFLFGKYLGFKYVGKFGGNKKQVDKLITIVSGASIIRASEDSPLIKEAANVQVLLVDESHLFGAENLSQISTNILAHVPYRMYFSGTQVRNDGSELLLKGIIGPIVKHVTVKEGIAAGILAKPSFHIFKVPSSSVSYTQGTDALKVIRKHLLQNPNVYEMAASIINKAVFNLKFRVLVLVDEISQFNLLAPRLNFRLAFAYGGWGKLHDLKLTGDPILDSPNLLVSKFEKGDFPVLVGTGVIGVGTDIPSVDMLVLLQGGKSVIKIKQAIGRAIRSSVKKKTCEVVDFDVYNIPVLHNMSLSKIKIYKTFSDDISVVNGFTDGK